MFTLQFAELDTSLGIRRFFAVSKSASNCALFSQPHSIMTGTLEFCPKTKRLMLVGQSKNFSSSNSAEISALLEALENLSIAVFDDVRDEALSASSIQALQEALEDKISFDAHKAQKADEKQCCPMEDKRRSISLL